MRILLIDGSNNHLAARSIGLSIDYKKLHGLMSEGQQNFRAYYFTALPSREVRSNLHQLVDWLGFNGYIPVTKATKEYTNHKGEVITKGNMDVDLVIHALRICSMATEIYLFSGDGDFTPLVAEMQHKSSAKVICVSTAKFVASDLQKQCDHFIDLISISNAIKQVHQ